MSEEINPLDPDPRGRCLDCRSAALGACVTPSRAGLSARYGKAELSRAFMELRQRCPAFLARATA